MVSKTDDQGEMNKTEIRYYATDFEAVKSAKHCNYSIETYLQCRFSDRAHDTCVGLKTKVDEGMFSCTIEHAALLGWFT